MPEFLDRNLSENVSEWTRKSWRREKARLYTVSAETVWRVEGRPPNTTTAGSAVNRFDSQRWMRRSDKLLGSRSNAVTLRKIRFETRARDPRGKRELRCIRLKGRVRSFSGLKKNHTERRDGGEKSTNNRLTSMAWNSTHFWQTILPRYFSRRPFFHCLFSSFLLLSPFLFFFFCIFFDLGLVGRSIGVGPFLRVRNYNCNYRGFECRSLRELDFFRVFK